MTAWDEVRAAGIAGAKTFLDARKDAEVLRDHVVAWIDAARDQEDITAVPTGTDDLASAFRAAGLPDLAEYARAPSGGDGPIPSERWLFAALLGRACAVDFSFSLNTGKWRDPHFWGLESYGAWDAYLAELIAILPSSERSRESFWAAVSGVIDTMASDPGSFAWGRAEEKNGVRVAVDEYRTQPSINEAWETRLDSYVWPERAFIFGLARQLDAARLFGLAERLPHPAFLRLGISDASGVSEHEIARLLTLAPPSFDPAGIFQSAGMIAVHLLEKASGRLRWLAGHGRVYDVPHSAEDEARIASDIDNATAGLNGILDALFARPDAKFLGWAWLERLVYEGERRGHWRPGHHAGRGGYVDTWLIVVRGLAQRLGPRSDAVPWVLSREYLWRSDRVTAALAAALFVEPSNGTALMSLLRELLTSVEPPYTGAAEAMYRMDAPLPKIGGHGILALDEPAAFLTSTWQNLRPYRERAWRAHTRADESGNVAEIFVLWAMQATEIEPAESARLLMRTVEAVLCDAFQTDAQIGMREFWLAAVERFGRRIGKACPVNPDEIHSHVRDFIWPYLRDDEYVVRISMALHECGIKAQIITDALKPLNFDLTKAVIELIELDKKAGMRGRHNPIWLNNLEQAFCQNEVVT